MDYSDINDIGKQECAACGDLFREGVVRDTVFYCIEDYRKIFGNQSPFGCVNPESSHSQTITVKGVSFRMVLIRAGEFIMGSPPDEPGRLDDETQHRVRLSRDYWMGETQVTQALWEAVMGNNPSEFNNGGEYPVESVSWDDSQTFIQDLNRLVSGGGFRLPTEAEWEYACRAGTNTPFHTGRCLGTHEANYDGNYPLEGCPEGEYRERTTRVASFAPNAWGLYDMHGNVYEWCQDWYDEDYPSGRVTDPSGPSSGASRVHRGGCWVIGARYCRSASRNVLALGYRHFFIGLRLARTH